MKLIPKTEHTCSKCSTRFYAPSLNDFSYGEFLLWSASGECRYLNAFEDSTYKEVIKLLEEYEKLHILRKSLQEIYGELACDPDEKNLCFHITNPPCPKCRSTEISSIGGQKIEACTVPNVTHIFWNALTYEGKKHRLNSLVNCGNDQ